MGSQVEYPIAGGNLGKELLAAFSFYEAHNGVFAVTVSEDFHSDRNTVQMHSWCNDGRKYI
jgi:hypothetical protein